MRKLITVEGVCDVLGISRGTFYAKSNIYGKSEDFPKPIFRDGRLWWNSREVEAFKKKKV